MYGLRASPMLSFRLRRYVRDVEFGKEVYHKHTNLMLSRNMNLVGLYV
jgi:hypothetical protein